jgi:hypothetical protein
MSENPAMTTPSDPTAEGAERAHRDVNPVSLVVGLLYVAIGLGVLADRRWGGIDLAAVSGTGAVIAGLAVIVLLLRR